jgi:hypothetical protein
MRRLAEEEEPDRCLRERGGGMDGEEADALARGGEA